MTFGVDTAAQRQNGILQLLSVSTSKGYITFDDILEVIDRLELPLDEVDRISGQLLSIGCIIKENDQQIPVEESNEAYLDRSKLDYEAIYEEVLSLDQSLASYIDSVKQIPPPALREVENLIYQAKDGNNYAKTRIISMYLKVVVRIALWASKKYKIPIADTIQNGNIGLVIAVNKFDPRSGYKFSTYAPWWVWQNISREATTINPLIYFPVHIKEKLFELYDIAFDHNCEECNDNDICENLVAHVMEKLEIDYSTAHKYLEYLTPCICIDDFLENEDEILSDFGLVEYEMIEQINLNKIRETMQKVLTSLKPREREILLQRFGFINDEPKTLEQVGQVIGVTRERIRQIEAKALKRLRHPSRGKQLKRFL